MTPTTVQMTKTGSVGTAVQVTRVHTAFWFGVRIGDTETKIRCDHGLGGHDGLINWFWNETAGTSRKWCRWFSTPHAVITFSTPDFRKSSRKGKVIRYRLPANHLRATANTDFQYDWDLEVTVEAKDGVLLDLDGKLLREVRFQVTVPHFGWWHTTNAGEVVCCE